MLKTLRAARTAFAFVLLLLLLVWAVTNWYAAAKTILLDYTPLPVEDYWRVVQNLGQYKSFDLRFLWKPHNEHRIVFPEMVFACDMLLAHGRRLLPLILSCVCYLGILVILAATLLRDKALPKFLKWAAVFIAAAIMGWKGNAFVLAEPFLLQWTLTQFCIVASFACLVRVLPDRSGFLACSIIAGTVATYSSGNGMLVWPLLICSSLILRFIRRQIVILTVAGLLAIGLYFIGYHSPERLDFKNFFLHPIYSLEFVGAYMGMPFGGMKGPRFGPYVGITSVAIMAFFFGCIFRKRLAGSPAAVVMYGSYAFGFLTAILTAAGRMDPTDAHYSGAESARYITLPLVSWALFVSAAIWTSARSGWNSSVPWAITIVTSLLLLIGLPKLRWWFRDHQEQFAEWQFATLAVENGIADDNVLAILFPDPGFVRHFLPILRTEHLSIFSRGNNKLIGEPLSSFGPIIRSASPGHITYTFAIENGLELAGSQLKQGKILLANDKQQLVGFGGTMPAGWPSCIPWPPGSPLPSSWIGFANLATPSSSISVYDATPTGLIALGSPVPIPSVRPANEGDTGPEIRPLSWRVEPADLSDRTPMTFIINPPGPVHSTWQGTDAAQASIESSAFAVPPNRCIVVPVLTGPSVEGLSVVLRYDLSGLSFTIPMQERSRWWRFWRVPMPPGVNRVQILAEDRGSGRGQWLAIAAPRECR